ncbi:MAG: glycosidase, partial [Gemmatimonadota bacterium]|nr:glycosidase [Gemmatimonadota bacterium]
EWLFSPREPYERFGDVGGAVFPCGWTLVDDEIRLYYGAADTSIGLATGRLSELLAWLDEHDSHADE